MRRLSLALLAMAYAYAEAPALLAIRDARVVTMNGPALERATVVVDGPVIAAVGTDVAIPAGAKIIDGRGLTVYPGLIDAMSNVGLPSRLSPDGDKSDKVTPVYSKGPEDRPSTTSWVKAAFEFDPGDRRLDGLRRAGFTSAGVFPMHGILAGQGAAVELDGTVLDASLGQYIALRPTEAGFPSTLFGAIAYIRQLHLDLRHYQSDKKFDRALEGLAESRRLFFPADRRVDIDRMSEFAAELKRPTVLYGFGEGYRSLDILQEANLPSLVSLHFANDAAVATPRVLRAAGLMFAFYLDGEADPFAAVRKSLAAGLKHDDAVRAFTVSAAQILGISQKVGTIERGKVADLVVSRGALFEEGSKIEMVVIRGREHSSASESNGGHIPSISTARGNQ